ncbi:MAG: hypothetical protein JXB07_09230 [Anaerolineae bacterium]|nr:hypothetical protein [Anaerolineae bacterium]
MAIRVEKIENEPIIVYHWPEKLTSNQELREALEEATQYNPTIPDPVIWVIHNTGHLTIDFGTVVIALSTLTKGGPEGFNDPRIQIAAVSQSELVRLAARSASQKQYGNWQVVIFDTYEQALAHVREDLARQKSTECQHLNNFPVTRHYPKASYG